MSDIPPPSFNDLPIIRKDHWGDVPVSVVKPVFSDDPEQITAHNMFYFASVDGRMLYGENAQSLSQRPKLDFFIGDDTLLSEKLDPSGTTLLTKYFAMEYSSLVGRLLTWNEEKGEILSNQITEMMKKAKKVALVVAHGDTYGDEDDKFWGINGVGDRAYGADRVVKSLMNEDYDVIVFWACNPDNLPLEVENSGSKRPSIIRFALNNSFDILENIDEPIKIIPEIK